jgi:hypothetical protein
MSHDRDPATEAKLDAMQARVREIVATCPPDPNEYMHVVTGYLLDEPAEGSAERKCDNCGDPTVIDPHGQMILLQVANAKPLCAACASIIFQLRHGVVLMNNTTSFNPTSGRDN